MEGVGARLGRSSSRYGTTTVFNGPVRKWKKKWVQVRSSSKTHSSAISNLFSSSLSNGANDGSNASHLLLFKWTPLSHSKKENDNSNLNAPGDVGSKKGEEEEPPRRKFKYVPVAVLEEQKQETEEKLEDEAKRSDDDVVSEGEQTPKSDCADEKPDINDVPMDDCQVSEENKTESERQDLNVSTLDLSLGLTSHEEEHNSDSN